MKVRITKSEPYYWYSEHVGKEFNVSPVADKDGDHKVLDKKYRLGCIHEDDFEIVIEEKWTTEGAF